ncbi:hypothetical protein QEN19_002338 [Hanseniaspora menglaensis]
MGISIDMKKITELSIIAGTLVSCYYLMTMPSPESIGAGLDKDSQKKSDHNVKRILSKRPDLYGQLKGLNSYEKKVLADVLIAEEINVRFKDVGGLDDIIEDLKETVIYPLVNRSNEQKNDDEESDEEDQMAHLYESGLLEAPKGVLLYGPPGSGKSLTAKCLAGESHATFINVKISTLLSSYYGESNKLIKALFSIASKLKPTIIFIDEIDALFRKRSTQDHEVSSTIKSEFLSLLDGLESGGGILMMGATNRRLDIDEAFLRRMPKQYHIELPNLKARIKILNILLKKIELDSKSVTTVQLAKYTPGYSGSDLKEICRDAVANAAREFRQGNRKGKKLRPLILSDFTLNYANLPGSFDNMNLD